MFFHRHKWSWQHATIISVYAAGAKADDHPIRYETEISGHCSRCGEPKFRRVEGQWQMPTKED